MTVDTVKQVVPGIIEVNSSTLIIGPTGSGKSALLATAYEYVWEEHKMISLHYNSDPGGFPDKLRALIAVGIVRVWRMQSRGMQYSFETAALASRGYWPARVDPKSGMSPLGVRMIPPVVTTYIEICGNCGQEAGRSIAVKTLMHGLCPHCQQVRSSQTAKMTLQQTVSKGFENVGTRGYDGLTSLSDWYLQDMSHRAELGGEEGSIGGKITSGDLVWRQNNRAQIGFAQSRAHELIVNALEIPGMVVQPLWTAMSSETMTPAFRWLVPNWPARPRLTKPPAGLATPSKRQSKR
jgi:energy-coupling factor transporter ATP-binding protein EcfA2